MIAIGDIREWRGHDVRDVSGHKIGTLESVYVDTATDEPSFATVMVGLPTRHRLVFVPLTGASVGPGYLKVGYDKHLVKEAPSIGTDGELPAGDEEKIFAHYSLDYQPDDEARPTASSAAYAWAVAAGGPDGDMGSALGASARHRLW
jgi:hypothetical protein